MMATAQSTMKVGKDLADVVGLAVDSTPNREQLFAFFKEGSEFSRGLLALSGDDIPEDKKPAVLLHIARGFLETITTQIEQYKLPSE